MLWPLASHTRRASRLSRQRRSTTSLRNSSFPPSILIAVCMHVMMDCLNMHHPIRISTGKRITAKTTNAAKTLDIATTVFCFYGEQGRKPVLWLSFQALHLHSVTVHYRRCAVTEKASDRFAHAGDTKTSNSSTGY